ncbi:hypothetical protein JHK87_017775 [Glycine soja]|nr:hypothetical protein JHK87_017775 [Glycine soja]
MNCSMAASRKTSSSNRNDQIAVSAYLTSMKAPKTTRNSEERKREKERSFDENGETKEKPTESFLRSNQFKALISLWK